MISNFETTLQYVLLIFFLLLSGNLFFFCISILKKFNKKLFIKLSAFTIIFNLIIIGIGLLTLYLSLEKNAPNIKNTYPDTEAKWDLYENPIMVEFNVPVEKNKLDPSINPNIKGTWVWEDFLGINSLTKKGYFYPEESLFNDQRIVIYITGISRPFKDENHEFGFVFDSPNLPYLTYTTPFNGDVEVPVNTHIELNFNKPNNGYAEFQYKIEPEVSFTTKEISPTKIAIYFNEELKRSQTYLLTAQVRAVRKNFNTNQIIEIGNFQEAASIAFTTKKEPLIKAFSPKGTGVQQDTEIIMRFEVPMETESVLQNLIIEPKIDYDASWNDTLEILRIKPKNLLPKDTPFKFTLKQGILSKSGGISTRDIVYEFRTVGPIIVKKIEPQDQSVGVKEDVAIKVIFDQPVEKESAQSKFSITPNVSGTFYWENDSTMLFKPTILSFNTTYTVRIAEGISSIYGLPNEKSFSSTFTVRSNQVVISMPQYYQPQSPPSFSCNVYAARMALAWKGFNVGIISLISEMGYNDRTDSNGNWLGNPYKEYVGTYDGSWGYGVYWGPIQKLFTNRGIQTELKEGWNLSGLAQSIEKGNPVIIWRYNGESYNQDKNWIAEDGTFVRAINGQHGAVVTGFKGTSDNPTHILLNDPWYGKIWIQASLFDYYWSRLGRVGLIIY
jgi:uncharacterized protein YvpB